jgi:hypothetical protein
VQGPAEPDTRCLVPLFKSRRGSAGPYLFKVPLRTADVEGMDAAYRFAFTAFVLCLLALGALLVVWLHYLWGPALSVYDVGSPQLRAFV